MENLIPVWKRKSDAFLTASSDGRLTHGMFRVLLWLAERTFWRRMGGDTAGSIIVPRDDIARSIRSDKQRVSTWLKRLETFGYVRISKIHRPGRYPMNRYTVLALCPEDCAPFPEFEPPPRAQYTLETPAWTPKGLLSDRVANATLPKVASATTSRSSSQPSSGAQTLPVGKSRNETQGGRGIPPTNEKSEGETNGEGWREWCARVGRCYDRELETRLSRLKDKLKLERGKVENYKMKLKKESAEFISYANKRKRQLDPSTTDGKRAIADYERRVSAIENDQSSYVRDILNPSGAAIVANLTRKIRFIEEQIH